MTDYKAIADRLVERGVGKAASHFSDEGHYFIVDYGQWVRLPADRFCHDWRVAGACMERMGPGLLAIMLEDYIHPSDCKESFPLAIILAYLESSESENNCSDFENGPSN